MGSKENSQTLLVGMQNDTTTLENGLTVSFRVKHTLTLWSRNHTPRYLPKRNENLTLTEKPEHNCL